MDLSLRDRGLYAFGPFRLDRTRRVLTCGGAVVALTPKLFDMLLYLVENPGRVIEKDEILNAIWPGRIVEEGNISQAIFALRKALSGAGEQERSILTVPGRGYRFTAPVELVPWSPVPAAPSPVAPRPETTPETAGEQRDPDPGRFEGRSGERRQLTVMACELVGLAALSIRLDPEELRTEAAACHRHCTEIVEQHSGYVARYSEDGLLVYFGYPDASEHDAEHAVRAGLALLGSTAQLGADRRGSLGLRVGIASGLVVIGDETAGDEAKARIAAGEAPHLARRLQLSAGMGDLVVDQSTRRLVGGLFEYRDLGPVTLGDYPQPTPAWRVLKPSTVDSRFDARAGVGSVARSTSAAGPDRLRTEAVLEGGLTPFVGRVRELELLAGCLAEAADGIRVVDIVGDPGIGKSRLLHEFRSRLKPESIFVMSGSCWPDDRQVPFRPFIEVARQAFRLRPSEPEAEIVRKLEAGLTWLGLASDENLALLLNLLGLKPPGDALQGLDDALVGSRTRDLLLQLVRERCRLTPAVMLLEDLHWIDGASQDLLARLIGTGDFGALAILHTRRPGYQPPWSGERNTTILPLAPLAAAETSEIVQARLVAADPTGALARLIVDRAEGNPLFAEEIANFLAEGGIGRGRTGGADHDSAVAALPASVQSLLTARVDRLAPDDRALLQAASVIGRRFAPDLLTAVIPSTSVEGRLPSMEKLDLIRRDDRSEEFVFKHALVRDALYAGLLSGPRKDLHLKVAGEIERRNAGRLGEVAESLAHHYSQAGHTDKSVEYLALAGRKSLGLYSLAEAEHALRSALALARAADRERMDAQVASVMVDLATLLNLNFKSGEILALIEPELRRIDALGDSEHVPILLDLYGVALFTHCRFREGRSAADKALTMAERLGDPRSKAHARAGVISLSIFVDPMKLDDFERFVVRAFSEAEGACDAYIVGRMMTAITWNYANRGLALEGRRWAYRLMAFGRDRQDRRSQGMALWLLGWLDIIAEDYVSALGHGEECTRTALAPYDRQIGQTVVGVSQLLLGQVAEGSETIERHREQALANGWRYAALGTEGPFGVAMLLSGKIRKGVRQLKSVIRRCESEYGYQVMADLARIFLAEFYIILIQGTRKPSFEIGILDLFFLANSKRVAFQRAEALLKIAIRNPSFGDGGVTRARIDFNLGLLYKAKGRLELARAHLAAARDAALAQDASALIAKIDTALTGLCQVGADRDEAAAAPIA